MLVRDSDMQVRDLVYERERLEVKVLSLKEELGKTNW